MTRRAPRPHLPRRVRFDPQDVVQITTSSDLADALQSLLRTRNYYLFPVTADDGTVSYGIAAVGQAA